MKTDVKIEVECTRQSSFPSLAMCITVWVTLASVVLDLAMGDDLNLKSQEDALLGMALPGMTSGEIRFKDDSSSFKIAIFADLHYGENAWELWGPLQDVNSTAVQSFLLDLHLPGENFGNMVETSTSISW